MSINLSITEIWNKTLDTIRNKLSGPSYETWLKSTRPISLNEKTMLVEVPTVFARDWLESRYASLLEETLSTTVGRPTEIEFFVANEKDAPNILQPSIEPIKKSFMPYEGSSYLNPKYTFDTFVIGDSNRFAHAASLAVAEAPARAYNPLFIYGDVGLGKTHLMQAIGHYVFSNLANKKVVYVSSETFTNELINSIRDDKTVEFRNKYRTIDILLVDDIQFLAGKERTQEEFFHTFNALHEANRQIVISSDRPPREILTLEERLRSRFEWGLITDIQKPDLETRTAILKKKASLSNYSIPYDVINFIADHIQSNIRELEGALTRVVAYSSLQNTPISVSLAQEALMDILALAEPQPITIDHIQKIVSEYYSLQIKDMFSKKRTQNIAFPRQIAMYLARELTDASLPQIGEEFGGRDHTTVIHAYNKISEKIDNEISFKSTIKNLTNLIKKRNP